MYAQRSAQEAYVESLQRMTVEQLIAEVMRVQMAAADLIKQEYRRGYEEGHLDGWESSSEGFNSELGCEEQDYKDLFNSNVTERLGLAESVAH